MTKSELLGRVREQVGATDKNETSDARLMQSVDLALSILGDELSFRNVELDLAFALVADQKRYQLPSDVLLVQWVEHAGRRLEPVSLTTFDRDFDDWRARQSGTPNQFAIRGRYLYLDPPADSSAVSEAPRDTYSDGRFWECECSCGSTIIVRQGHLLTGHTRSCGCYHHDVATARHLTHGHAVDRDPTPEYRIWLGIKRRCYNSRQQNFPDYGGRGIRLCEKWHDFSEFYQDVGPRPSASHSIDRIDNNGHYEPGNVRWATASEQARNRRPRRPRRGRPPSTP